MYKDKMQTSNHRIVAVDVLRGLTISCMVLVNNPGSWSAVYAPLCHAHFNGLTPTDLVFPFFMCLMGMSMYLSLVRKQQDTAAQTRRIFRRTALIFLFGLLINALSHTMWHPFNPHEWRILGVLQRLALAYGGAGLLLLWLKPRRAPWAIVVLLAAYSLMLLLGQGYELSAQNIVCRVDLALLGEAHMYHGEGFAFDPEGLLSTIPSVAHVLLGAWLAHGALDRPSLPERMLRLMLPGFLLMASAWLLSYGLPINKKIWSPTFVMVTCGACACLLAVVMKWLDGNGRTAGLSEPLRVMGMNPMLMFVTTDLIALFMSYWNLHGPVYAFFQSFMGDYQASLAYALCNVAACMAVAYGLHRRGIVFSV